jgi:hypothetical protein
MTTRINVEAAQGRSQIVTGDQKIMNKRIASLLLWILIVTLTACSGAAAATGTGSSAAAAASPITVEYDPEDLATNDGGAGGSTIELAGDLIVFHGTGAIVDGAHITITAAGRYTVSGTLDDGQIIVDSQDEEAVVLVLDGADIACSTSAPIYVLNAGKLVITLADGSENSVTDGASYLLADDASGEPNAAIFSKDDLTINGTGSLTVHASYRHGIVSKDDLKITGGTITVDAAGDGIKGKDSIAIRDGSITIHAAGDGLQAYNDADPDGGTIAIEGGRLDITAGLDGIQAETRLLVSGGTLTITSGGGSANGTGRNQGDWGPGPVPDQDNSAESAKGIKAGADLTITGGSLQIDSSDDALHSNDSLTIDGGEFVLSSGDDGIHADASLTVNGGTVTILQSYEGIESTAITIRDGTIHILASDDGINGSSGNGGFAMNGRAGQFGPEGAGDSRLTIAGGTVVVDANGDGLDVNGPIAMSGGLVLVNGPTSDGNGALDYMGAFEVTGGTLVAVGSAGMAQAPSATSTQYSVLVNLPSAQAAGTPVHIESEDGEDVLTFVPTKAYRSVVVCSPDLENGATYLVYTGGSTTGTVTDSLVSGGSYSGGTEVASLTITGMVTSAGSYSGGFPGAPGGRTRP